MAAYTIGSEKGKNIASNMKSGSTYKASDGSTWKKESDGSVTVTSKDGTVSKNAYTSSGTNSTVGGSGNSTNSSASAATVNANKNNAAAGTNATTNKNGANSGSVNSTVKTNNNTYNIGTAKGNDLYNTAKATGTASFKDVGGDTVILNYDKSTGKMTALKNGVTMNVNNNYNATSGSAAAQASANTNASTNTQGTVATGANSGTGRTVYSVNGSAPSGLRVGDNVITGGGTYQITGVNADGTYQSKLVDANKTTNNSSLDFQSLINDAVSKGDYASAALYEAQRNAKIDRDGLNYAKTYNYSTVATDNTGKTYNVITQKDGTIRLIGSDGSSPTDMLGIITVSDPNNSQYKKQYIATNDNGKTGKLIAVTNSPVTLMKRNDDGSYDKVTLQDEEGNTINSSDVVYGEDGLTYYKATGESLGQLATRMGLDNSNYAFAVGTGNNERFYTLEGTEITGTSAGTTKEWTQDELLDKLYNAIMDTGYNNTPKLSDYDTLTWEQALSQASEQLNGQYSNKLNDTLDELNQRALETGFYGQLPTEALRQQAVSSNEVERQSAINELARNLLSDSRDYASTQLKADSETSETRMNTILQIYNMLAEYRQQELENAQTQEEYDQTQQELINDAMQLYISAINNEVDPSSAYSFAKSRVNA